MKAPITKTIANCPITRVTSTLDIQETIVAAATKSNLCCQYQPEGTAFSMYPFLDDFGYCANNRKNVDNVLAGTYVPLTNTGKYA